MMDNQIRQGIPPRFDLETSWMGVDFDGTLHYRERGVNNDYELGEPVPLMVEQVKHWLSLGMKVKIVTARVSRTPMKGMNWYHRGKYVDTMFDTLNAWCIEHIGQKLPLTSSKDANMYQLWDDRAVAVERNTGKVLGGGVWSG